MDTNKMREQFEAAYERGGLLCMDGPYDNPRKNQALAIWKSSREAVVVELPSITGHEYDPLADADYREGCRAAIEAQGLKVKP